MKKQMREQDIALAKILRGDKAVDITKSEDLFYQVNKDRVSIEQFTNRDKFKATAEQMKEFKRDLVDKKFARTPSKHGRLLGEIPAEIFFARKELSDPSLSLEERTKNIKKWLNDFPAFKAGDARL